MTQHSVRRLLKVFRLSRENYAAGMPLHRSYHAAVRAVAKSYALTYQTIGDTCRRRLELTNVNELHDLLRAWVRGYPGALVRRIKERSDPVVHFEVDRFFAGGDEANWEAVSDDELETFSFVLHESDGRLLRALAGHERVSVGELTARLVSGAVRERMRIIARALIEEPTGNGGINS
jgi:hypothetical protein